MNLSSLRRRQPKASKNTHPTWQDNMQDRGAGDQDVRYVHIPQIDRWRAVPCDMPPDPERGTVLQRMRQLTESLAGGIHEGTGRSLDPAIESWVAAWIATVETDYTDHRVVIQVHRRQAEQRLAESTRIAKHERTRNSSGSALPTWPAGNISQGNTATGRITTPEISGRPR
jgi:hypothetical protein